MTESTTKTISKRIIGRNLTLSGEINDEYFKWLLDTTGIPENDIVSLIRESVKDNSVILDIGANIGYVSSITSIFFPKAKIYAFEPSKKTFDILRSNIKQNDLKNVKAHNYGISNKVASHTLTYSTTNSSGAFINDDKEVAHIEGHASERVQLKVLDKEYEKLGIKKCDLMKIDVEGHELSVIKGAEKFIKKFKPTVIMEANHWCLNVFARTSMPDFTEELYKTFDYVFAFADAEYLDLSDSEMRYHFYYQNTVNNKFMNLYCGFDKKQMIHNLERSFVQQENLQSLQAENVRLASELDALREQLVQKRSPQHRAASKLKRSIKRR